jgi:beta-lactamase class A
MKWIEFTNSIETLCKAHTDTLSVEITYGKQSFSFHELKTYRSSSIIKIPLVLAIMRQIEEGALDLTDRRIVKNTVKGTGVINYLHDATDFSLHDLMKLAIIVSDHTAANMLIEEIGTDAVNAFSQQIGAKDTLLLKPFMTQNRMRDNFTTAKDMVTYLQLIGEANPYFNEESRRHLYGMLYDQQLTKRLGEQLGEGDIKLASLSGTNQTAMHDVGIFSRGKERLYVAALTENLPDANEVLSKIGQQCIAFLEKH